MASYQVCVRVSRLVLVRAPDPSVPPLPQGPDGDWRRGLEMTDDGTWPVGHIVFETPRQWWMPPRTYTDAELTEIYNRANGIPEGKAPPITTQRIFNAMRAMLEQP